MLFISPLLPLKRDGKPIFSGYLLFLLHICESTRVGGINTPWPPNPPSNVYYLTLSPDTSLRVPFFLA